MIREEICRPSTVAAMRWNAGQEPVATAKSSRDAAHFRIAARAGRSIGKVVLSAKMPGKFRGGPMSLDHTFLCRVIRLRRRRAAHTSNLGALGNVI
jgi:hypothetical protein